MKELDQATRTIMWNIDYAFIMYILFLLAVTAFCYGLYLRVSQWRKGKPDDDRLSDYPARAWKTIKEIVLQNKVRVFKLPGLFHSLIFYSFAVLIITTAVVALDYDFGTSFFKGWVYVALTVGAELAGLLILVGCGIALYRRYVIKPPTLMNKASDGLAIVLLLALVLTGFLVEGLRMATTVDRWYYLSPVGYVFSFLFFGISPETGMVLHKGFWWFHTLLAMFWLGSIPYSKFSHIITVPLNTFFQKLRPRGELKREDLDAVMNDPNIDFDTWTIGLRKPDDFTWKQRLDFDACIDCGRCEEVCPSVKAGSDFSPRTFIAKCRELVQARADTNALSTEQAAEAEEGPTIVGTALSDDFIWRCRTCMACMAVCPACIDHVDTMVDVRRNEVMIQGNMPRDAKIALKLLETNGNPFGPQDERSEWIERAKLRVVGEGESCDVLYWIGCCTTYDTANQNIAQDLCAVMDLCNIDYGVLSRDERCCGDPARLLGDERLFQEIAKTQIEILKSRKFKLLLTSCPHCYNVLKNEYKLLGGDFNVAHHSEFLHELVWRKGILPKYGVHRNVVFHDPCYLGRYQQIFDSPREVIKAVPGCSMREMENYKSFSLCCGAGGGHFWMDLKEKKRVNRLRMEQVVKAEADTVVTACSYCKRMLEDGVKMMDLDDKIQVIDIGSLLLESLKVNRGIKDKSSEKKALTEASPSKVEEANDTAQAVARMKLQES